MNDAELKLVYAALYSRVREYGKVNPRLVGQESKIAQIQELEALASKVWGLIASGRTLVPLDT